MCVCYKLYGLEIKGKEIGLNNFLHRSEYKMYIIENLCIVYSNDQRALVKLLEFSVTELHYLYSKNYDTILQDC